MKKTAKSTQDFKAIKAALKLDGTIFTLKGQTTTSKNEAGVIVQVPQRFKTSMHLMSVGEPTPVHSFSKDHWLSVGERPAIASARGPQPGEAQGDRLLPASLPQRALGRSAPRSAALISD